MIFIALNILRLETVACESAGGGGGGGEGGTVINALKLLRL